MSKRALSLDDLVNHDENDKNKLQKLSENIKERKEYNDQISLQSNINDLINKELSKQSLKDAEQSKRFSNVSDILNTNNTDGYDKSKNDSEIVSESISSNDFNIDSDETDTDDELGGTGEVNFDAGMTFNYDKHDKDSPKKQSPSSTSIDKNTLIKSTPELKEGKAKETSLTSQKNIKENNTFDDRETSQNKIEKPLIKAELTDDSIVQKGLDGKEERKENSLEEEHKQETLGGEKSKKNKKKEVHNPTQSGKVNDIFKENSSSTSKKNTIKKDLQILQEITSASKPNKYKNVPIWAQKWKPTLNVLQQIDSNDFKLDPSFLNIIPDDDLTKSVQDWVYATIFSIDPEVRQFIELEMKFGIIREGGSPDRINPPISSQAVYTELDAHMTPNIDEVLFKELNKYIRSLGELTENSGKFSIIESTTKDSVYRVGIATQRPRFLRMSTDTRTGRIGQFIEKRHISQLLLYSPKDSYDVKISLNLELPVPENDPPEKYQSQTPISIRTKERVSYIHNDSCTRIDVTKVQTLSQNSSRSSNENTYEVELEINTPALITAFDNITTDSRQYAELIRTFLNNGTIIRRKLTSLSAEIFEGTKK